MPHRVFELFPIPVYETILPEKYSPALRWFETVEMYDEREIDTTNYGTRSKDSYILNNPKVKKLKEYILQHVTTFAIDILNLDYKEYKFTQSWLSYKYPGQHHTQHTHPNSVISGVFFFGNVKEQTPALRFHKASAISNQNSIFLRQQADRNSHFSFEFMDFDFQPGLMLLFPSYLTHSVPINTTNESRCSLAFNVVPTEGLGEELALTELKF